MKRLILIMISLAMILTLVACTTNEPAKQDPPVVEIPVEPEKEPEVKPEEPPTVESKEITLYFANKKYTESGDETLEKMISETRTVEDKDDNNELSNVIPSTAKLLDVEVLMGTAIVDLASEGLGGGSMQEYFTLNQIIASLLELEYVDRVKFLVDGEETDSLMGHYDIEDTFDKIIE